MLTSGDHFAIYYEQVLNHYTSIMHLTLYNIICQLYLKNFKKELTYVIFQPTMEKAETDLLSVF